MIKKELLDILACPACDDRPGVELKDGVLQCPKCGRIYPIENGIPIMLVAKAKESSR
ncbi:MAG: Trm112 family protein [Armatimonadetes bacterium]|nr:Trm112 family protein [Armatimonadota bacterium]